MPAREWLESWKDSKGRRWGDVARRTLRIAPYGLTPWRCALCDAELMRSFTTTLSTRRFPTPGTAQYELSVRCNSRFRVLVAMHRDRPCPPRPPNWRAVTKLDAHLEEIVATWTQRPAIVLLESAAVARCLSCPHQFVTKASRRFRTKRVSYEQADRTLDSINHATLYGMFLEHGRVEHGRPPSRLERRWLRQLQEEAALE